MHALLTQRVGNEMIEPLSAPRRAGRLASPGPGCPLVKLRAKRLRPAPLLFDVGERTGLRVGEQRQQASNVVSQHPQMPLGVNWGARPLVVEFHWG